jgi:hypothetical protein
MHDIFGLCSEVLDLVVDNKRQKLIQNPAHGGEQMTEEY